jgi:hypothetical protein
MPDRFQRPSLKGQRHDDPPKTSQGWKFRLGLAAKKYPVQIALLCAMVPVFILSLFILGAYHKIGAQQAAVIRQQHEIQVNRQALTFQACLNNNTQTRGLNKLNDTVQAIIASGPRQNEQLRPLFKDSGIDFDKVIAASRRAAREANADLQATKVSLLNCVREAEQVQKLNPPKRKAVQSNIPPGKK